MALQLIQQAGGDQLILNGLNAGRRLRMIAAHVVLEAERVSNVGSWQGHGTGI
jgi:hypothetical protein